MIIPIKTPTELMIMREGGEKLAKIVRQLTDHLRVGSSGQEVEELANKLIALAGGQPSFPLSNPNYPYTTCVSIDSVIVHGLPTAQPFQAGQIVGLDIGMYYKGFHLDTALTGGIEPVSPVAQRLIQITRLALAQAIRVVRSGIHLGLIGYTINQYAARHGLKVIRQLTGHGVGRQLHEPPQVSNFGLADGGPILQAGMVLAIEPMISTGDGQVYVDRDGWAVRLKDRSLGAHFEHTVAVTDRGAEILTA